MAIVIKADSKKATAETTAVPPLIAGGISSTSVLFAGVDASSLSAVRSGTCKGRVVCASPPSFFPPPPMIGGNVRNVPQALTP